MREQQKHKAEFMVCFLDFVLSLPLTLLSEGRYAQFFDLLRILNVSACFSGNAVVSESYDGFGMTALHNALFKFVTNTRLAFLFPYKYVRSCYRSFWFCTLQFDIMKVVFASALVVASADFAEFKDETEKFTIPMMWRHTTRQTTTCRMLPSERPEFAFRIW